MKAPEGMKWIDVTYTARRVDQVSLSDTIEGEAGVQILINEAAARYLATSPDCEWNDSLADPYLRALECILRGREELCRGKYVEGSIKDIRIMEDDDE